MRKFENGSCIVEIPTIAAMILATLKVENPKDFDNGDVASIALELLKQRHLVFPKFPDYAIPTYEDFDENEVKEAEEAVAYYRKWIVDVFLPSMEKLGYCGFSIVDECLNDIYDSRFSDNDDWTGMWRKINDIADYRCDYIDFNEECDPKNEAYPEICEEYRIFVEGLTWVEPEDKDCLFCISTIFRKKENA